MQFVSLATSLTQLNTDALVLALPASVELAAPLLELDRACGGWLSRVHQRGDFVGKKLELLTLPAPAGIAAGSLTLVGLGERESLDAAAAFRAGGVAAKALSGKRRRQLAFAFNDPLNDALLESFLLGAAAGCEGQDLYRKERLRYPFDEIALVQSTAEAGSPNAVNREPLLARCQILADSVSLARRLVNEPAEDIYPETFAAQAQRVAAECDAAGQNLAIDVWDEHRLAKERCGSLLMVARGSSRAPRLVRLRYRGGKPDHPPLAIVGKGVTFDSGGLSLKPPDGMLTMKCDMAGAATMLAAMRAIALLKLPINVIGLCGLVENMTGPAAVKLGDVLRSRAGKTIEVHNTDAEGRLVLADVLNVALDDQPKAIVDLATLTGACVVALGTDVAGLMTNNQAWADRVLAAARGVGEPLWQLPMYPDIYDELIRCEVADMKNVGDGRWGGAITAAKFLEQFVDGKPWVHLDIAGPAFRDKPKLWCDGGGSGQYVRTLVELAAELAND